MISLHKFLEAHGLPKTGEIKFYRHTNHILKRGDGEELPVDVEDIPANMQMEAFQSIQGKHVLGNGFVGFFIGETENLARFTGLWRILDYGKGNAKKHMKGGYEFFDFFKDSDTWYNLEKLSEFEELADRLVVKWPLGRASNRWFRDKDGEVQDFEINQIRSRGLSRPFPGFDELIVSHNELSVLREKGDGGTGWIASLKTTRGVYLITDTESGDLYVGSATGADGIWGRWSEYAKSIHGGNRVMIDRVAGIEKFSNQLQFSILETMGNLATRNDGIKIEKLWKKKLGRKAIVLNAN